MKKYSAVIIAALTMISIFLYRPATAQTLPKRLGQITFGYSRDKDDKINGKEIAIECTRYLSKKVSVSYNVRGSIHKGSTSVLLENTTTGSKQFISVEQKGQGVQTGVNIRNSFIRTGEHEFLVSLGAFGRYQSFKKSYENESEEASRKRTGAVGGTVQLQYNFTCDRNMVMGIVPGFQIDTNKDAMFQLMLTIGKRF